MTWENVTDAFTQVGAVISQGLGTITGNVVLMTCLAAGLIPVGLRIFRKAKKAVR